MLSLFLAAAIAWDIQGGAAARRVVGTQPFEAAALSWSAAGDVSVRVLYAMLPFIRSDVAARMPAPPRRRAVRQ